MVPCSRSTFQPLFTQRGTLAGLSYNGANVGLRCGTALGLYQIQSSLGVGGMGEVYRATDTRLGRDVAVKVLPAEMASDTDRLARFRREAKALAQIDHPGIVTIYSVEECDGVHFLTMQLVDGQPLDRLIPKGGMTVERVLEIGAALADALAAAHEKGIVHRDLKPANVMVTSDERVKVLDFGLAKDVGAKDENQGTLTSAGQTQDGIVMGTPSYMSPEQVSGRAIDHRTDIFSLGVLLHEMTVGTRPFEAPSSAELFSAILRDTPPAVNDLRAGAPIDLARVIRGCLEKDPRHRTQTARDVSNAFREMLRGTGEAGALPVPVARAAPPADSGVARAQEGFWVAVLPFKYTGSNPDLAALAEGVTDDIVTNMSKFSYLRVVARSSTARYAEQTVDVRTAAKELGARYVMEGSIRQAGAKVRFAVQMVDANNGTGLWAETYDRAFTADSMLDVLDDVVPCIVATVGDARGILAHSMTESLRGRDPATLTPYEALLRSFGFHQHVTEEEQLAGVTALENAVKQAPDYADCWAMLSWLYRAEYTHKYNPRPDSMDRSLAAARRAVNLAPSSQLAHAALASAHFFRHELGEFRASAERALALNRMQGYTTAFLGLHFAYSGDWERGCALAEHAIQLNPNHPGWYWMPMVVNAYRQHDGERALQYALRMNMPGLWTAQLELAVVYSQLGRMDQARVALRDLLALRPQFTTTAREDLGIWWQPDLIEQMLGDLAKIGLTFAGSGTTTSSRVTPSIAVLPLANLSADADQDYFSDGLAEEIINLLAKIPGLKVIARTSSFAFRGKEQDVTKIAQALRVRNILEGSVRRDGNRIRITAQLIDATDGAHRWSERYDREMNDVFAIQDEIGRAIAEALELQLAPRVQAVNIEAWQHCLKGEYHRVKYTPGDLAKAKEHFEQAIAIDPGYAHAYVRLAAYYYALAFVNMNRLREMTTLAKASAEKALALDPGSMEAHSLLAVLAAVVDHNWKAAAAHHSRAMAEGNIWPAGQYSYAIYYLLPLGRTEEAIEQSRLALENDPLSMMRHMGVAFALNFAKRYDESIEVCRRALEIDSNSYFMWHALGMAQFFSGRNEDAILSLRRTVELAPWYATGLGSLASACHRANDQEDARECARRLAQSEPDSFGMAEYHATTGDADAMFKALDGACAKRDVFLVFVKVWPTFDPYRADSRFQSLIERMNLA